jgi:hypothetical protein
MSASSHILVPHLKCPRGAEPLFLIKIPPLPDAIGERGIKGVR